MKKRPCVDGLPRSPGQVGRVAADPRVTATSAEAGFHLSRVSLVLLVGLLCPWLTGCEIAWTADLLEEKAKLEQDIAMLKRKLEEIAGLDEEINALRARIESYQKKLEGMRQANPEAWRRLQNRLSGQAAP